jgi:LemA protein
LKEMNASVAPWFVFALLLFWAMGAYNRLVRLRSRGISAFANLETFFNQYISMVKTNVPEWSAAATPGNALPENDASVAAWAALAAAADQLNASLKVAHTRPLNGPTASALRTAFETLCLSWLRLRDLPADLAGAAIPDTLQSQWETVAVQVERARTDFNRTVTNYNQAINQFPALLLARVFGLEPAQPL